MPEERNVLSRLVRRPFKIVKNFLKWQIVISILAIILGMILPYEPFEFSDCAKGLNENEEILFTKEKLSKFNGENDQPLYLALLGSVYDVSKGIKHYGTGCEYNFFVGRDASVSFISGNFDQYDPETADDVIGQLKLEDMLGLANWQSFYAKSYTYKGKLIGRFYDESGMPTKYYYKYVALLEQAERQKTDEEQLSTLYPDCNIKWSEEKGSHVWCTETSGGKNREWKGYPRKLFKIGSDKFRCACVQENKLQTKDVMLKEYDNCDPRAFECFYRVD